MIVGIMQPYLFPYLGYYQLVNHCDKFVFYDDVTYIKSGYINRNYILSHEKKQLFTVPIKRSSSYKKINELNFDDSVRKNLKTIEQSYSKAPYFEEVMPIVSEVLNFEDRNVAVVTSLSVTKIFEYLGLDKKFYLSSNIDYDRSLSAADKLISICKYFKAKNYCNPIGGKDLYDKDIFSKKNIELDFIKMDKVIYAQNCENFVPNLSIIDILMWNSKKDVNQLLSKFKLA